MRELTLDEIEQVSGGASLADYASNGAAGGSFFGAMATNTLYGAARGGAFGALMGAAYGVGYSTGTLLYDTMS
tara:strand:- start:8261 stop:8479 length:219 start_codon:yes stop_codon:yes gene_type:complete